MPFCPACGAAVEGRFCAKCGSAVGAAPDAGSAPGPAPAPAQAPAGGQAATSSGLTENVASALCYLFGFITGIIFLVLAPYNQNKVVRFHAFQSIFMSVACFVIGIGLSILSIILSAISFWLGTLFGLVHLVFGLGIFILWLYMMFKTYNNAKVILPVIGPLAEKQA
jgi:uncharacterized membrane protein